MKKIEVRPEKVRGMGNLIPPLSVSDFELSDCMIHEEDPFKINGYLFNHFSIDVPVVPVNLVLSTNVATIYPDATTPNTAVITATLTDSSGAPVSNVDVYFQEEGVRIGTASTNAQGACTFEYSNSSGGTHTIRAYTTKQGKYNKSSAEINVNVYMPTSLSLSPVSTSANTVDIVTLSSKIIDQNDLPLAGKLIDLYHGNVKIKSDYSNSKGIVEFPIRVTDLGKTDPPAQTPVLVLESVGNLVGETGDLITFNLDSSEHLNLGETVQLINTTDNSVLDSCTIISVDNTLTYTCTGKGDVSVKAKVVRGTEVTYSNILNIEDCLVYDTMTSESDRWVRTSDIIVNIDSEGTKFSTNSNSEQQYRLPSKYFTPPYTIEFDWVDGGGNQKMALELWPDTKYSGDTCWYGSHWDSGANKFIISTYPSSTSSSKTESYITRDINPNDHLKFIVEPNNVKLYQNGELILSKHQGKTCDTQYFCFYTNKNRIQKVKNLKIKHYSE